MKPTKKIINQIQTMNHNLRMKLKAILLTICIYDMLCEIIEKDLKNESKT